MWLSFFLEGSSSDMLQTNQMSFNLQRKRIYTKRAGYLD